MLVMVRIMEYHKADRSILLLLVGLNRLSGVLNITITVMVLCVMRLIITTLKAGISDQ